MLSDFRALVLVMPTVETHVEASELYDKCRKEGLTVRSAVDCLIAALAIEYDLSLLQSDRDYGHIEKVSPLRLYPS